MTFDKEEHKQAILELIANAQFKGSSIDFIYDLRKSVAEGNVKEDEPKSAS